jgi:hypothetical protein
VDVEATAGMEGLAERVDLEVSRMGFPVRVLMVRMEVRWVKVEVQRVQERTKTVTVGEVGMDTRDTDHIMVVMEAKVVNGHYNQN